MCLLVLKTAGKFLKPETVDAAWKNNSDGGGIVGVIDGEFVVEKSLNKEEFYHLSRKFDQVDAIVHFRFGTSGTKGIENVHPFLVTPNLYMAHNGVFMIERPNKDMSDTWHFVQKISKIPNIENIVDSLEFQSILGMAIGKSNKLIFLRKDGKSAIINQSEGHTASECWFSNYGYRQYSTPSLFLPRNTCTECGRLLLTIAEKGMEVCYLCAMKQARIEG